MTADLPDMDGDPPVTSHGADVQQVLQTGTAWNGMPYTAYPDHAPQLTVLRFRIPANSSLPWHEHVVPNVAFVISGAITLVDRDSGAAHTVMAGHAFGESVGTVHRGFTGDEPADIVVTYAGADGLPLSVPR